MPNIPIFSSPVIKLDPDPRPQAWGQALGSVMGAYDQQQVLQQGAQIQDPQQRMAYFASNLPRLGPQGKDLLDAMVKQQELQTNQTLAQSKLKTEALVQAKTQFDVDHQSTMLDLELRKERLQESIAASEAAGRAAQAALAKAEIGKIDDEIKGRQADRDFQQKFFDTLTGGGGSKKAPAAPGPGPGDTHPPLPASPSAYSPGQGASGGDVKIPIAFNGGTGPDASKAASDIPAGRPGALPQGPKFPGSTQIAFNAPENSDAKYTLINDVSQGGNLTDPSSSENSDAVSQALGKLNIGAGPGQYTPELLAKVMGLVHEKRYGEAAAAAAEKDKPIPGGPEDTFSTPGVKVTVGKLPDGSWRVTKQDVSLKEPDETLQNFTTAVSTITGFNSVLEDMYNIRDTFAGMTAEQRANWREGPMGNRINRLITQIEQRTGTTFGEDLKTENFNDTMVAIQQHISAGLLRLAVGSGTRGGEWTVEMMGKFVPQVGDTGEQARSKLLASRALLQMQIKSSIMGAQDRGMVVPRELTAVAQQIGLMDSKGNLKTDGQIFGGLEKASLTLGMTPQEIERNRSEGVTAFRTPASERGGDEKGPSKIEGVTSGELDAYRERLRAARVPESRIDQLLLQAKKSIDDKRAGPQAPPPFAPPAMTEVP